MVEETFPTPLTRRTSRFSKRVLLPLGILVLLAAVAAASFIRINGDTLWHRAYAAHTLQGIYVTKGNASPVHPHAFGLKGLRPYALSGIGAESLGEFDRAGKIHVAIVQESKADESVVRQLRPEEKTLSSKKGVKAALEISPDGAYVAYAIATSSTAYPGKLSLWEVHLITLASGMEVNLGTGYGPTFVVHDGKSLLVYTTNTSIVVYDVRTQKSFATPFTFKDNVGYTAKLSPDGAHMGLREASGLSFYEVYRIGSDVPLGLTATPAHITGVKDFTLTNAAAFITQAEKDMVSIRKAPYDSPTPGSPLYTFPASIGTRLIP